MPGIVSILPDLMGNPHCILGCQAETLGFGDCPIEHVFGLVSFPLEAIVQLGVPLVGSCQVVGGLAIHGALVDVVGHFDLIEKNKSVENSILSIVG
jgi:hypothetical protein